MLTSFHDLVGTAHMPAHCFDSGELTGLTPALEIAADFHDTAAQASEAARSPMGFCSGDPAGGCVAEN